MVKLTGPRLGDRAILLLGNLAGWLWGLSTARHLTTDPACARYRATKPGSSLDRAARGESCVACLAYRARRS